MDSAANGTDSPAGRRPGGGGWEIGVALFTYAAASAADYLVTLSGLLDRQIRELNPFLNLYIEHLGPVWGLLVPKVLLGGTVVLSSSLYLHAMYRSRRTRLRPEVILYAGAVFTALAPLHWIFLDLWRWTGI